MKTLTLLLVAALTIGSAAAQEKTLSPQDQRLYALARTDIKAFAH